MAALVAVLAIALAAVAGVPPLVNYQGRLQDSGGEPVTTPVTVVFAIWDDTSAGDSLWSEQQNITPDADGLFSVLLGSVSPIPDSAFAGAETYLSIKIGADPELSPRQRLASVPYTYSASSADLSLYSDSTGAITDGAVDFADIGQNGAASGQIMKWDGAAWVASDESAVPDNDWTLTGDALYTAGEWGMARAGNTLYGTHDSTHVNLGVACTTGTVGQNYKSATVSDGVRNTANNRYTTVGGGQRNTASGYEATVGGGAYNIASVEAATVGGGGFNTASGDAATVGGGGDNTASSGAATIGGGIDNTANGEGATVGGGWNNAASGEGATVGGGLDNTVGGGYATVGGGYANTASGNFAAVPGGAYNVAQGDFSFAAGRCAKALHAGTFVWGDGNPADISSTAANQFLIRAGGGMGINLTDPTTDLDVNGQIRIRGGSPAAGKVLTSGADGTATWETPSAAPDNDWTLIGSALYTAGDWGIARAGNTLYGTHDSTHVNLGVACTTGTAGQNYKYATVGGGRSNTASIYFATVGGGEDNTAGHYWATVGGGDGNTASGGFAVVGGGSYNTASGEEGTTVGGGIQNTAGSDYAVVGGGALNTASGYVATIPGGYSNLAQGDYSLAAGLRAKALHNGTFVWGDATEADFSSTAANQFLIRAGGGVGVGTDTAYTQLTVKGHITPGDSAAWDLGNSRWWWRDVYSTGGIVSPSDRRLKTDVEDLGYGLEEILKLRPVSFSWKNRKDDGRYVGFIAQEVQPVISEVVNVGDDPDQTLGLRYEKLVPVLVNAVKEQQKTIDDLRAELAQMKVVLQQLVDKSDDTDGARYSQK
jgi:hypothetical protein